MTIVSYKKLYIGKYEKIILGRIRSDSENTQKE